VGIQACGHASVFAHPLHRSERDIYRDRERDREIEREIEREQERERMIYIER
jgi:hypothetical protein